LVDRFLRRVPERDRMSRTAALDLLMRIAFATSDRDRAIATNQELEETAARLKTDPLRAMAASSRGFVALIDRRLDAARTAFGDAVDLYTQAGMPFEAARARLDRADGLEAAGRIADAVDDARAAERLFDGLGAAGEAARARAIWQRSEPASAT